MEAAIIAVGSELLGTERLDTNSLRISVLLERYGVDLTVKSVVGDDEAVLSAELRRRLREVDLIVVTGGLGPTADDVTRAATAAALGRAVTIDEAVVEHIRGLFARLGRTMPEVNRRQGEVIAGAELIENRYGTAPGMRLEADGATLFLFPGVPRELEGMLERAFEPWLRQRLAAAGEPAGKETRVLKVACLPESTVEERITPAYQRFGRESITVLASPGEIKVVIVAKGGETERRRRLDEMQEALAELIGAALFADRADATLESVVGELLQRTGRTVTTAESCTGGLIAERLTRVAGSSAWFLGGVVTYSNELKTLLADVPARMIEAEGAVSEPVARAMAHGARRRYHSDYAVAVTGVAGPGGGSEAKPVGTVHVAVAGPGDGDGESDDGMSDDGMSDVTHRLARFPGNREQIRWQSSQLGLELLRRRLLAELGAAPPEE